MIFWSLYLNHDVIVSVCPTMDKPALKKFDMQITESSILSVSKFRCQYPVSGNPKIVNPYDDGRFKPR